MLRVSEYSLESALTVIAPAQIDVHAALTVADVLTRFGPVRENASRVDGGGGTITIFLDEVNTASCMGLFKEIVIDHSICGERLPANVVVIAACNPARSLVVARGGVIRHDDLGKDWLVPT